MPHPKTDPKITEAVTQFAVDIGMVPISIGKEQNGYVLNSLLVPWLVAAQSLVTKEVASPEDVDKTWMISAGMLRGPFAIMDMVGLETARAIMDHWGNVLQDKDMLANAKYLQDHYISKNNLGMKSGKATTSTLIRLI